MSQAKRKKTFKKVLFVVIVAAVVAALVFAVTVEQPVPVELAPVNRGEIIKTLDEEGETRVRERYLISTPVTGRLLRVQLEPGDPVYADETQLATLLPSPPTFLDPRERARSEARVRAAEAQLAQAEAERQRAAAQVTYADSNLERYAQLAQNSFSSREQLERAQLEARTAAEDLKSADFSVRSAQYQLAVTKAGLLGPEESASKEASLVKIPAPVDGVVLKRYHESAGTVTMGEVLMEVADPTQLEIVADFLSADAVKILPGQRVIVDRWGGDHTLQGVVRLVEPSGFTKISALGVEEQRVNVLIDLPKLEALPHSLGDGYRVEVRVVVGEAHDVVLVPAGALFRSGPDWAVFVFQTGRARLQQVTLGLRNAIQAQVLDGLSTGEQVILHPGQNIADGVSVEARKL